MVFALLLLCRAYGISKNFSKGSYRFTQDLLQLELASAALQPLPYLATIVFPLRPAAWERAPQSIPDRAFTAFLLRGLSDGFHIGVMEGATSVPCWQNRSLAYERPDVISAYLAREVDLGLMSIIPSKPQLGPPLLQISPIRVIPKKNRPDRWRLIVDLSSLEGHSVNDAIRQDLCSVSYASLDHAIELAKLLGPSALLAKLDLKEAYRAVPVHLSDQRLLAVSYNGTSYLNKALPFGLRLAPKLFSTLTGAMMWVLRDQGVHAAVHNLDDFLVQGHPDQPACGTALLTILALCDKLGFLVVEDKTEGPTTALTFLSIEIDTQQQQIRLPQDKLGRLTGTIAAWMSWSEQPTPQSSGKKRDLLSLLGLLHHTASVVRLGRAFLCSLIHAAVAVKSLITGSTSTAQREQTWLGGTHSSVCGMEPALCLRQDPPPTGVRCFWGMGLWSFSWQLLVPAPVA